MQRKVISQGGGGYTIYLPKKWVEEKGISPGEPIEITESGTFLIVGAQKNLKKEITIDINENNKQDIRTLLTHIYRQGFDRAIIKKADEKTLAQIRKDCASYLLGFEVSETSKNHCVVESISEPAGEKYDVLLKRTFYIIKETISLINEEFTSKKFTKQQVIESLKLDLDKYILFCRRSISKERMKIDNPLLEWELLTFLMHIEHALYRTYSFADENNLSRKNKHDLNDMTEYFTLLQEAYYLKDIEKVHKINSLKKEYVISRPNVLIAKSAGKDAIIEAHLKEIYRLIQIASSPILGIILQSQLEK